MNNDGKAKKYPEIREAFAPGDLTAAWQNVLVFSKCFSSTEHGTEREESVARLQENVIKWARCKPWPPEDVDHYAPESVEIRLFARQAADFYYFLGAGDATNAFLSEEDFAEMSDSTDIEAEIVKRCLDYWREKTSQTNARMDQIAAKLVDYLSAHIGEKLNHDETISVTGGTEEEIASIIDRLADGGTLAIDYRQVIRSVDAEAAKRLLASDKTA